MSKWQYEKGLHDVGNGVWAYLQPDGGWGWSNAGLIRDGDQSLLVDTLFDEKLTGEMLGAMKDGAGIDAKDIATLVNTHANGDHTYGNRLVSEAEIIASKASAEEMNEMPPEQMAAIMKMAPQLGPTGQYFLDSFGVFEFDDIKFRAPTRTFTGKLDLKVGDKDVELIEVGPAHTKGDVLVWVPGDKTIFTGDILFIDGTPLMWAGPVSNWIKACDFMMALDVDVIVPGHGPVTDKAGVKQVRDYLAYVDQEARKRFDAGMSAEEAGKDIALNEYGSWLDAERIMINVNTLYGEYGGEIATDVTELFRMMAEYKSANPGCGNPGHKH